MVRLLLSIIACVLFLANFAICERVYPGSKTDWNIFIPMDLTCHNMWAVIILCSLIVATYEEAATQKEKRLTSFFLNITMGFSISDIMDRLVFNITNLTHADYVLVPLTILICLYRHVRNR